MKKLVLIFSATIFLTLSNHAQQVHFGLKAGVNFAKLSQEPEADYEMKTGVHVGGLAHIHISDQFAVQPELMYSTQGTKFENLVAKRDYLNIPVLAQFMFGEGFRLQTGPQVGFLISAKNKNGDTETEVNDYLETVDFAWVIGTSYLFPGGIGIDARYNHGLSDVYEDNTIKQNNRVFQVGLFYQFMHNNKTKTHTQTK
ncbi:MAG TPA: porin family protein [Chitinophagaceae bacterium]